MTNQLHSKVIWIDQNFLQQFQLADQVKNYSFQIQVIEVLSIVNIHLKLQSVHHMCEFQEEIRRLPSHKLPESPN